MELDARSLETPSTTSRRQLVKTGALALGAAAAATLLTDAGISHAARPGSDLDILNYALTLEHIEDAMYKTLLGSGLLYGKALAYATTFGAQEHTHVVALTATIKQLGGTPVAAQAKYNFPMLASLGAIVGLLVTVEDLGASAYLGAAPMIQDGKLLSTAVAIHSIEAQHATAWRNLAGMDIVPFAFATGTPMAKVVTAVTPFLK